ncbi:hypothetical protein C482_15508 [Natrialba chahannaoensis JCM 10990]|uniref:Uncharacterized protein n=1 Tax=Natrialba chahannaoensis JCM 10990 TaxID=1227492 RepID=M0AGZ7_9EURY|nr:hypothetical protein [Natrialba chahannaoensis]ELY96648.1 hypothetical protein C482_15508 [Natrialba chahannaoensis JCM 10990]
MSATNDRRQLEIDLESDLQGDVPPDIPTTATLTVEYGDEKTVRIEHGTDEWTFEFEGARCVDRDPSTRPIPNWINEAMGLVEGELR